MKVNIPFDINEPDKLWKPRWYQLEVLKSPAKNKVVVFPRRSGKTDLAVQYILMKAIETEGVYAFLEPTYKQSKENIWRIFLPKYLPKEIIAKRNDQEQYLKLINNSEIYFKGANDDPEGFRGAGYNGVVFDEVREMNPIVFDVIIPMLKANNGWALYISTPKGKDHFYRLFKRGEIEKGWQSWLYSAYETKHIPESAIEEAKREMTNDMFKQELLCEFLDKGGSVFRNIRDCVSDTLREPHPNHFYQIGVDLGKNNDWTVIIVVDCNTWDVVAYDRFNQIDWAVQEARIEAMSYKYNRAKIILDSTAVGDRVLESLRYKGLDVQGVVFNTNNKTAMIMNLITKMEKGQIRIPDWKQLIDELEAYEVTISPSGRPIYKNSSVCEYDDCVCALMLAFDGLTDKRMYSIFKFNSFYNHISDDPYE